MFGRPYLSSMLHLKYLFPRGISIFLLRIYIYIHQLHQIPYTAQTNHKTHIGDDFLTEQRKQNVLKLKKISKILTINILYELTSYFCNMFHFFQYIRRCIYMTFVIRFYSLCTCLHFPSQYIACFLYKDHVEKVHLYVKQISRNIIL